MGCWKIPPNGLNGCCWDGPRRTGLGERIPPELRGRRPGEQDGTRAERERFGKG